MGYRGISGTEWTELASGNEEKDWNGYYLSPSPDEAGGYALAPGGTGSVWSVSLNEGIRGVLVTGIAEGASPDVGMIRSAVARLGILLEPNQPLVEALGSRGYAYVGPSSPGQYEIVLSRELMEKTVPTDNYYKKVAERHVDRQEIVSWTDDGGEALNKADPFPVDAFPVPEVQRVIDEATHAAPGSDGGSSSSSGSGSGPADPGGSVDPEGGGDPAASGSSGLPEGGEG